MEGYILGVVGEFGGQWGVGCRGVGVGEDVDVWGDDFGGFFGEGGGDEGGVGGIDVRIWGVCGGVGELGESERCVWRVGW